MSGNARLGFVGLGTMGKDLLREAVKNPKAEVAALCDIEPGALAEGVEIAGTCAAQFSSYAGMLATGGLDGVVVATPQYLHAPMSIEALGAGINTFSEKPMALNVHDCRAMIGAAAKNGKALMIGQVLRYIGPFRYVLELIKSGELGRPFAFRGMRGGYRWGGWMRPWRQRYAQSGGYLLEVNAHEIDLMLQILGPARSVSAAGSHFINEEIDYEDFITLHLEFENGGIGTFTGVQCDYIGRSTAEIFCEKGTVYYDSIEQKVRVARDGHEPEAFAYNDIHPEWESGTYREIREFIETCLGEHPVSIAGEEGLRVVEIGQAAYLSAREKREVALPL
jgi:predicted dehydrogenase